MKANEANKVSSDNEYKVEELSEKRNKDKVDAFEREANYMYHFIEDEANHGNFFFQFTGKLSERLKERLLSEGYRINFQQGIYFINWDNPEDNNKKEIKVELEKAKECLKQSESRIGSLIKKLFHL